MLDNLTRVLFALEGSVKNNAGTAMADCNSGQLKQYGGLAEKLGSQLANRRLHLHVQSTLNKQSGSNTRKLTVFVAVAVTLDADY